MKVVLYWSHTLQRCSDEKRIPNIIDHEEPAEFLYEDEEYAIIANKHPKAPIHYLIIPKKPIESIKTLKEEDKATAGGMFLIASKYAREQGIEDCKPVISCGKHQDIPHLHLHFLAGGLD